MAEDPSDATWSDPGVAGTRRASCRSAGGQARRRCRRSGRRRQRAAQRLRPAPARRSGRGRPTAEHLGHRPSPGTPPAGCTAGTRAARRRTTPRSAEASLPMTPGTQPGHRLDHHERGGLPAREHEVADRRARRRRGGRPPAGRRPRSGRTAARTRRRPRARGARPGRSAGRPARAGTAGGAASAASTAANSGSGAITMPGAAAERGVVDAAVPVGRVLARVVQPHVERARGPRARPSSDAPSGPSRYSGKIVKTSMRTVRPLSGSRRAGRRAGRRRRRRRRCSTTNTIGTSAPPSSTSRSCAGFASTATTAPERRGPTGRAPRRPTSSCTQSSSSASASRSRRRAVSSEPRSASARVAVVDALERARATGRWCGRDDAIDERAVAGVAAPRRARRARAGCW